MPTRIPPSHPRTSRGIRSSGSAIRIRRDRKRMTDDGRHGANRRGVPIEVDAKSPTLECEQAGDRRRTSFQKRPTKPDGRDYSPASPADRNRLADSMIEMFSGSEESEPWRRDLWKNPAAMLSARAAASTAPPSAPHPGGGDRAPRRSPDPRYDLTNPARDQAQIVRFDQIGRHRVDERSEGSNPDPLLHELRLHDR